jgi:hypothetical protein
MVFETRTRFFKPEVFFVLVVAWLEPQLVSSSADKRTRRT